jgi:hypothetical protein
MNSSINSATTQNPDLHHPQSGRIILVAVSVMLRPFFLPAGQIDSIALRILAKAFDQSMRAEGMADNEQMIAVGELSMGVIWGQVSHIRAVDILQRTLTDLVLPGTHRIAVLDWREAVWRVMWPEHTTEPFAPYFKISEFFPAPEVTLRRALGASEGLES